MLQLRLLTHSFAFFYFLYDDTTHNSAISAIVRGPGATMRQEFQDGLQHTTTVYPLATVSPVPPSSLVSQPRDVMEECNGTSKDMLDDDEDYDDEIDEEDTSWDEQPITGDNGRQEPTQQVPQALFLNFTSDLEPHVNVKTTNKPKKTPAFKVNGVNLLNRKNVDSKTAIERIQRRRENHNHVERRRRDNINNIILEISRIVPNAVQAGQKLNKGKVLKMALDHILELQRENQLLRQQHDQPNEVRATGELTLSDGFANHGASIQQSRGCGTENAPLSHTELPSNRCARSTFPSHAPPSAPNSPVQSMHISPHLHHSTSLPNSPMAGPVPNMTLPPLTPSATMPFTTYHSHRILHAPHLHPPPSPHAPPMGLRHQTAESSSTSSSTALPPLQYEKLYGHTCRY